MGVKFKDIVSPKKISFQDLDGRIIAIDAANSIYQFLSSIRQRDGTPLMDESGRVTSHLSGILYRTSAMMEKGIKPIYIFDGKSPDLKGETISKRTEIRQESEKKWKEALGKGDIEEARKYAVRSSRMSSNIVESSKKLLQLMGIPFIQAYGEGESQASYLVENGDAWAVASQDYDCILFGAPRVVRNLTISGNLADPELMELNQVENNLEITRNQLIDIAILVGTDFNQGIRGIGAKKGLKLIKKYGDVYSVLEHVEADLGIDPQLIRNIFLKPEIKKDYNIKWDKPDHDGVIEFLCAQHSFSQERVSSAINKIKKMDSTQKSLEDWF
ncbi:flap endonuclease-1 [Methanobacterium alcaliphilum]|uniref:flap endonuclease-1 n=1 Tax=Methanobacterium alcaliphilum TaxID=392018 RepID=UPI00200AF33D|nr:flap endonuclease-1 [Methanobacterium alcaliphilum]MCK9152433.1 flap endonuclease-1 [Methanobacterium alcaliphilum]